MKDRFSLCPPVADGCQFWMIEDSEKMFQYVTIHQSFPNAEQEARRLYKSLVEAGPQGEKS